MEEVPEVEYIPYSCKYCLYWEFPEEHNKLPFNAKRKRFYKKLEWLNTVSNSFGNCGKLAYIDNRMVGYAEYALSNFFSKFKKLPFWST